MLQITAPEAGTTPIRTYDVGNADPGVSLTRSDQRERVYCLFVAALKTGEAWACGFG